MQQPGGFPLEGVLVARREASARARSIADVGILDGARWDVDEVMMREFPANGITSIVMYIAADDDHRYARLQARNRSGEATTTREQFAELNKQPNEIYIPEIGAHADIKLTNNYTDITDFEKDIEVAYREKIKPLL